MKLTQLSLFLENKPGHLRSACRTLAEADVNILTLSLADTQQFGILRLILSDPHKAQGVLEKAGFVVKATEVVAVEVANRPGGLAEVLAAVDNAKLNIEYMYAFTFGRKDKAVLIFRFDNPDEAIASLKNQGLNVLRGVDLNER